MKNKFLSIPTIMEYFFWIIKVHTVQEKEINKSTPCDIQFIFVVVLCRLFCFVCKYSSIVRYCYCKHSD